MAVPSHRLVVAAVLAASIPASASAEEGAGWEPNLYVSLAGGVASTFEKDAAFTDLVAEPSEISFNPGFGVSGAVGTRLPHDFRVELEIGYAENNLADSFVNAGSVLDSTGDVTAVTVMVNAFYDYELDADWAIYAGVGAGIAFVDYDIQRGPTAAGFSLVDGGNARFAYQVKIGTSFDALSDVEVFLETAYLGTLNSEFDALNRDAGQTGVDIRYDRFTSMLGVRLHF